MSIRPQDFARAILLCWLFAPGCLHPGPGHPRRHTWPTDWQPSPSGPPLLVDVADEAGLHVVTRCGSERKPYIIESAGSGAGVFDYDLDGDLDIYLVNGSTLEILRGRERPVKDTLYRNDGGWRFTDVTESAGLGHTGWGGGCAIGDIDGDGDPDLYVTNFGNNLLYENLGDGTFRDISEDAGVADDGWGLSAAFGDIDNDGDLDLYVTNYVAFNLPLPDSALKPCLWRGLEVFCGPLGLTPQHDRLFRNNGSGMFTDVSKEMGIHDPEPQFGMGVVLGDLDGDGWVDIYVANDGCPNFLFHNLQGRTFEEIGKARGTAYSADGGLQSGMGVDIGDFDSNGRPDIFVTNFSQDHNTLYRNEGNALFSCATFQHGLGDDSWENLGWGTGFIDIDNDGDQDLYVANGHVYPQVDHQGSGMSYKQADRIYVNSGWGRYQERSAEVLRVGTGPKSSRGAVFGDLDDDGDIDILVVSIDDLPVLLENRGGNRRGWLRVRLVGSRSNREGLGARIWLTAGGEQRYREATRSGSYCSSKDPRVHFGLGDAQEVTEMKIRWPSGVVQTFSAILPNQEITVHEDDGITCGKWRKD